MGEKKTKAKKKAKIDELKQRIDELENNWKRALADYQNLEKRVANEKQNFAKWVNAGLIDKLLPVLDGLQKAVEHHQDKVIKLIFSQFKTVLESEGVAEIKAQEEKFNPETMDAVEMVEGEKNKVIKVILKGYMLNDKVLRPAKVKVGGEK